MSSEGVRFTDLQDDYFPESEEHLVSIRRCLLAMDGFASNERIDPAVVEELFRALHSLKGLSSMAGVLEAEAVAHAMEEALRNIERAGLAPSEDVMEALAVAVGLIEEVVAARRAQVPGPDIDVVLSRLWPLKATPTRLWRFQFTPSPELLQRGVSVTSIQARLKGLGRIVTVAPNTAAGSPLTFDFVVACDCDESRFSELALDGVAVTAHVTSRNTAAVPPVRAPEKRPQHTVRVAMERLDELMRIKSDLVISHGRVEESLRRLESILPLSVWRELQDANLVLGRQLRGLREGVMRVRMVPIGQIFERMHFVIRGLKRETRNDVLLELTGQETEIDKLLVERMMDPLLHMVRNAVSHGLETPEERRAAGKSPVGHLRIRASVDGETLSIEVEDDGRGVDHMQVAERARSLGLMAADEDLDCVFTGPRLLQLLCTSGFSTRTDADLGAGRGIGMTVVRATIVSLGGSLAMETHLGEGTRFTIRLPLTLAIMKALIVYVDDQPFAVPRTKIHEVLRVERNEVALHQGEEVIAYRGGTLPLVHLYRLFQMNSKTQGAFHVLVASSDFGSIAIAVDRIATQREIVVQSFEDSLSRVAGIAGATQLGDGRPVLILDVPALVDSGHNRRPVALNGHAQP